MRRILPTATLVGALLTTACGPTDEDWPVYLGDSGRSHYSPLTEITRDNVSQLEVAWVYDSGEPRGAGATIYTSPLVIDGVFYGLSPQLEAFALNAATGEEIWRSGLGLPGNAHEDANAFPGSVRAFSAVDGSPVWQFDTIPAPGDPGSETWAEGSLEGAGGANVWTGMALDARTGELLWHFQVVRHDLWDKDNPSPPTLVQLERDGQTIDAVAITTKTGQLYVFDRETGESMYPIHEIETPIPSTLPGEVTAPTQPLSAVVISRQDFEITNRTEEAATTPRTPASASAP